MLLLLQQWANNGLPPAHVYYLAVWYNMLRMTQMILVSRYVQHTERMKHLALTPGEQYRRHLNAGGYRP